MKNKSKPSSRTAPARAETKTLDRASEIERLAKSLFELTDHQLQKKKFRRIYGTTRLWVMLDLICAGYNESPETMLEISIARLLEDGIAPPQFRVRDAEDRLADLNAELQLLTDYHVDLAVLCEEDRHEG